jgi:fatty acid CoA ligase FadD9
MVQWPELCFHPDWAIADAKGNLVRKEQPRLALQPGWEQRHSARIQDMAATDQQFRAASPSTSITEAARTPGLRLAQILSTVMDGYADRPALVQRRRFVGNGSPTNQPDPSVAPGYETLSYRDLWRAVQELAAAWAHADEPCRPGDVVCTLGFPSIDYTIVDLACIHRGLVSVPLPTGAPISHLASIIGEVQPRVVAVSVGELDAALQGLRAAGCAATVMVFDNHGDRVDRGPLDSATAASEQNHSTTTVVELSDLRRRCSSLRCPPPASDAEDQRLATLLYTSGSTGAPKGVIYTEQMLADAWLHQSPAPAICLHYLPMNHYGGRTVLATTLASGGTVYFSASADMSEVFTDLALVRPTMLQLVPRLCEMLFHRYQVEISQRQADAADEGERRGILTDIRESVLGGRCVTAISGSAPLSQDMIDFMEALLDMHLIVGYGLTEAGALVMDTYVLRPPITDYKLVDVPELGYYRTDRPHPRGELLVKATTLTPGYFSRTELNDELFDQEGYFKTGDIMAELAPDRLTYVDRRNNVLKLAQGEFVAISHLESIFAQSPLVRQIYIYGDSRQAFVVAVVVPAEGLSGTEADVRATIIESLRHIARDAGLRAFEVPRAIIVEREPFTRANGLLTGIGKLARPALAAAYGEQLEALYATVAESRRRALGELRGHGADAPVLDTVRQVAEAALGIPASEVRDDASFYELGGDSLAAVSFTNLLAEVFSVDVPASVVLGPTADIKHVARYIEVTLDVPRPTATTIHARNDRVDASELRLERFLSPDVIAAARNLPAPVDNPRTVLITGANGFLGRFLCLEWLQRFNDQGDGTVICVSRGADANAARHRIREAFATDEALLQRFDTLAADTLEVTAGDIAEPALGLDEATWHRLAESVDYIVHAAALVNHMLPYDELFLPNVAGTAELIRLALTERLKPLAFISTVGTAMPGTHGTLDEHADIRTAWPYRELDGAYASGYAASKWASEVLLRNVNEACCLPVAVFRPSMLLAHSRYAGQLNGPDMFTRLLLSLALSGIAPRTFYQESASTAPHYDGLPVDFVAEAITAISRHIEGFTSFNVVNPHDDGVSLDSFIDSMHDLGWPVERIDDYQDWRQRFDAALRQLPDSVRQHTAAPLITAFDEPVQPVAGSPVPADCFRSRTRERINDIPALTTALIAKYMSDLQQLGLLAPREEPAKA